MSDKCAPALDVSVDEQDPFGSFGEDGVQTLLSLALADPAHAKERFPAYGTVGISVYGSWFTDQA